VLSLSLPLLLPLLRRQLMEPLCVARALLSIRTNTAARSGPKECKMLSHKVHGASRRHSFALVLLLRWRMMWLRNRVEQVTQYGGPE
jgi:hypothetical protein